VSDYHYIPKYKDMILERLRIGLNTTISKELLGAQVNLFEDYYSDAIIAQISGYIWAEQLEYHEVIYPADWLQAFKERWFNSWMLKRWPVKYKIHKINLKAVFPSLKVETPDYKYIVRALEDIDYSYDHRQG